MGSCRRGHIRIRAGGAGPSERIGSEGARSDFAKLVRKFRISRWCKNRSMTSGCDRWSSLADEASRQRWLTASELCPDNDLRRLCRFRRTAQSCNRMLRFCKVCRRLNAALVVVRPCPSTPMNELQGLRRGHDYLMLRLRPHLANKDSGGRGPGLVRTKLANRMKEIDPAERLSQSNRL